MASVFDKLRQFLTKDMRMSHIYQPVMLMELLQNDGSASVNQIARSLLDRDESQIEYYEHITKEMVGRVLTKNRGITEKDGDSYILKGFETLSGVQKAELITLCLEKVNKYIKKRGIAIWSHRRKSSGYISGTLRYEVLKRAKFCCELCGISASQKALEADHIIPRNKGGSDDITNMQALCYSCNAMKRDRDDTDFRGMADSYKDRQQDCLFCTGDSNLIVETELAYAIKDRFPVTALHTLIIPKRHTSNYFDLYQPEINSLHQILGEVKEQIEREDELVTGFNIGINAGKDAGQTIMHCHLHVIPRRNGDITDPRGGVRGVIPGKQQY